MQKYTCPCCGYKTIEREDTFYDLCPVCFWETDPYQLANPEYSGGANQSSLIEAQQNFILYGACEKEDIFKTRMPLVDEIKDENFQTFIENNSRPKMKDFAKNKLHFSGWHLPIFKEKIIYPNPEFKEDELLISATLDHRFLLDLSYQKGGNHFPRNGFFLLNIKEGNTGIHYFNYMTWEETVEITQKWVDEIQEANKIVDVPNPDEEQIFDVRVSIDNLTKESFGQIVMSKLTTWRNMDWEVGKYRNIQIQIGEELFSIIDTFTDFENMILALQKSLPKNYKIETCFFCRFSTYNIFGNDDYGELICLKKYKNEFLKVNDKHSLLELLTPITAKEFVNETDYCDEFRWIKSGEWVFKNQLKA